MSEDLTPADFEAGDDANDVEAMAAP